MVTIIKVNEPPPPQLASRPSGMVSLQTAIEGVPQVYVEGGALAVIQRHIGWGSVTKENVVEQGGLLIGQVYRDEVTDLLFGVVEHALPARASHSSSIAIDMDHSTWADLYRRFDELQPAPGDMPLRILGWYHTHPNELAVFMSGTDRRTQADFFSGPEHFAFVFNPHRLLWKVFQGADCIECAAVAFHPPETSERHRLAETPGSGRQDEPSKASDEPNAVTP